MEAVVCYFKITYHYICVLKKDILVVFPMLYIDSKN